MDATLSEIKTASLSLNVWSSTINSCSSTTSFSMRMCIWRNILWLICWKQLTVTRVIKSPMVSMLCFTDSHSCPPLSGDMFLTCTCMVRLWLVYIAHITVGQCYQFFSEDSLIALCVLCKENPMMHEAKCLTDWKWNLAYLLCYLLYFTFDLDLDWFIEWLTNSQFIN